jgi:hypothetical protein
VAQGQWQQYSRVEGQRQYGRSLGRAFGTPEFPSGESGLLSGGAYGLELKRAEREYLRVKGDYEELVARIEGLLDDFKQRRSVIAVLRSEQGLDAGR